MPRVLVAVPWMLARFTGGREEVPVEAATLGECLDRLIAAQPALEPHLFSAGRTPREHLLFVVDGAVVDPIADAALPLRSGDRVVVHQAVSGG